MVEYHLQVIYNHALADGTSGMIITNEILSLYDQALENSDVLRTEVVAKIEKTWYEKIKPYIPDGTQNYEVQSSAKHWQCFVCRKFEKTANVWTAKWARLFSNFFGGNYIFLKFREAMSALFFPVQV